MPANMKRTQEPQWGTFRCVETVSGIDSILALSRILIARGVTFITIPVRGENRFVCDVRVKEEHGDLLADLIQHPASGTAPAVTSEPVKQVLDNPSVPG